MEALITDNTPTPSTVAMVARPASGRHRTRGSSRSRRISTSPAVEAPAAVQLGSQAVEFLDIPSMGESADTRPVTWDVAL